MPPTNHEALVHYEDTIKRGVTLERLAQYLPQDVKTRLKALFGNKPIAVWGSRNTPANRRKFDQMSERDDILIVEGRSIKLLGLVAAKIVSPDLSRELWRNLRGDTTEGWDLIYFIANAREIDLEFDAVCRLFNYEQAYQLRGFTVISQEKLQEFYDQYDDLYDVLIRAKSGQSVQKRDTSRIAPLSEPKVNDVVISREEIDEMLTEDLISDHVHMQLKLTRLGIKAGEKVWVPIGDQTRIRKHDDSPEFEPRFVTGIDLPTGYFENIDVIWKEQFRIDAVFEVENSTTIYSGLLRFADLSIVAPNTVYPLFIVAPRERRNQVLAQVRRPTFRELKLDSKVRFLPYDVVDDIERFYEGASTGPNVELIKSKSEALV